MGYRFADCVSTAGLVKAANLDVFNIGKVSGIWTYMVFGGITLDQYFVSHNGRGVFNNISKVSVLDFAVGLFWSGGDWLRNYISVFAEPYHGGKLFLCTGSCDKTHN